MKKVLSLGTVVFVCLSVLLMAIPAVSAETATGAAVTQKIDFGAMTALPATLSDTPFSVAATSAYSLNGDAVKYEMAADAGTSHYLQVLVTSLPSAKVTVTAEITGDGTLKPVLSAVSKDGSAILATQAAEVSNTKKTVVLTYSANAEGVAVVRVNLGASASDEVNAYAGTATLNSLNVSFGVNNLVVLNEGTTAPKKTAGNAPSNSWCTNGTFETVNPKFAFSVEDGVQVVHYNSDADLNGYLFYIIDFGEAATEAISYDLSFSIKIPNDYLRSTDRDFVMKMFSFGAGGGATSPGIAGATAGYNKDTNTFEDCRDNEVLGLISDGAKFVAGGNNAWWTGAMKKVVDPEDEEDAWSGSQCKEYKTARTQFTIVPGTRFVAIQMALASGPNQACRAGEFYLKGLSVSKSAAADAPTVEKTEYEASEVATGLANGLKVTAKGNPIVLVKLGDATLVPDADYTIAVENTVNTIKLSSAKLTALAVKDATLTAIAADGRAVTVTVKDTSGDSGNGGDNGNGGDSGNGGGAGDGGNEEDNPEIPATGVVFPAAAMLGVLGSGCAAVIARRRK